VPAYIRSYIRGRGAWVDKGNVIIHAGDKLIVNGSHRALDEINSKYIYEIGEELGFDVADPLHTKEAASLMEIMNLLTWDREINAYLLAGWCVVAPICGALIGGRIFG